MCGYNYIITTKLAPLGQGTLIRGKVQSNKITNSKKELYKIASLNRTDLEEVSSSIVKGLGI